LMPAICATPLASVLSVHEKEPSNWHPIEGSIVRLENVTPTWVFGTGAPFASVASTRIGGNGELAGACSGLESGSGVSAPHATLATVAAIAAAILENDMGSPQQDDSVHQRYDTHIVAEIAAAKRKATRVNVT
jgi:hypothetical protein